MLNPQEDNVRHNNDTQAKSLKQFKKSSIAFGRLRRILIIVLVNILFYLFFIS